MTLNTYETTIILRPGRADADLDKTVKSYTDRIKQAGGALLSEVRQGIKNLAYPIGKQTSGAYYILRYQAPAYLIAELERAYNIDEQIMRFLSVKLDKHGIAYHENKKSNPTTKEKNDNESSAESSNQLAKSKDRDRKKYCRFKKFGIKYIDYHQNGFLIPFLNPQGQILPRRYTGNSAKAQKSVKQAVKRARIIANLPFVTDNLK